MLHKCPWQKTINILTPDFLNGHHSPGAKPELNYLLFSKVVQGQAAEKRPTSNEAQKKKGETVVSPFLDDKINCP
jgi:hypothetical protein